MMDTEWIYGRNAVQEVLRAQRRKILRLIIQVSAQEKSPIPEIRQLAKRANIPIETVARERLDAIAHGHQGVGLEVGEYPYVDIQEILRYARAKREAPFILILDVIQDPQNLGSLLRSAECVGVHGVILPYRQAVGVTPAVVNSAAGASEHLLIARTNLAQTIEQLKKQDIWVVGLEDTPEALPPEMIKLDGALALVVGGEGSGIRKLVRQSCDLLMRLPMRGKVNSYNAAVAGSIGLFLIAQKRDLFK